MLAQSIHVQVAVRFEPVLVRLDRECPDQASTAFGVGEDADHVGAPLDLLVQAFQEIRRLQVFVMRPGQPVEGERPLDVLLDPGAELGVDRLPLGQPGREIAPGLGEIAAVVQPPWAERTSMAIV